MEQQKNAVLAKAIQGNNLYLSFVHTLSTPSLTHPCNTHYQHTLTPHSPINQHTFSSPQISLLFTDAATEAAAEALRRQEVQRDVTMVNHYLQVLLRLPH